MQRWIKQIWFVPLLLLQWGLLTLGAQSLSTTIDEPSHLTAGYTFLARGALWTVPQRGHPLLTNILEALPFYLAHPDIPIETLPGWGSDYLTYVAAFTDAIQPWLPQAKVVSRIPVMLLALLLTAVICRWAKTLWGWQAGLVALVIVVFDPTLLAHGRLATNDVGVTALGTLGLYLLWTWTRSTSWPRALAVGCLWGATLLAKGSGLLWVSAGTLASAWWIWRHHRRTWRIWLQWLCIGLIAGFLLWAGHGFTWGYLPDLPTIPVPAACYWQGILYQAKHSDKPITYVLGRWRPTGWIGYFPFALLVKNPIPLLLATLTGVVSWARRLSRRHELYFPVCFGAFYILVAIAIGPNVGYRHFIPVHPTLYLLAAGGLYDVWQTRHRWKRWGILGLAVWYCMGAFCSYPFELSYFNELVGGSREGWRYLEGSNTEWGQGWHALRDFETEQEIAPEEVAYTGWEGYTRAAPTDLWGQSLPPTRGSPALLSPALYPAPGHYVLSANSLSGALLADPDNYAWFRYHEPDAVLGEALFYYHVTSDTSPTWLAQCNQPVVPLSDTAIQEGFGTLALRTLDFDCSTTWVYPEGGYSRGVYALHADLLQSPTLREQLYLQASRPENQFTAYHLAATQQSYRQWESRTWPAMALYEWSTIPPTIPELEEVYAAPAEAAPVALANTPALTLPVPLTETVAFLGYREVQIDKETLELETWWEVTREITRPISIMAHLITEDGTALGVADGFGVAPTSLQPGDIVVQYHRFAAAVTDTQLWLRTGIYFLDTMQRIPVTEAADAIFVPVTAR